MLKVAPNLRQATAGNTVPPEMPAISVTAPLQPSTGSLPANFAVELPITDIICRRVPQMPGPGSSSQPNRTETLKVMRMFGKKKKDKGLKFNGSLVHNMNFAP